MYFPSPTKPHFTGTIPTTTPYHNPEITTRTNKIKPSPLFKLKINQLRLPLCPLVSVTTGQAHPWFPQCILNYWLLTEEQLDELARFYHQMTRGVWTDAYPVSVRWDQAADLETKRRRFGRFVGLRGCESPVVAGFDDDGDGGR